MYVYKYWLAVRSLFSVFLVFCFYAWNKDKLLAQHAVQDSPRALNARTESLEPFQEAGFAGYPLVGTLVVCLKALCMLEQSQEILSLVSYVLLIASEQSGWSILGTILHVHWPACLSAFEVHHCCILWLLGCRCTIVFFSSFCITKQLHVHMKYSA